MSSEHDDFIPWLRRDTANWLRLSLAARGAMAEVARKLNRKGELRLGGGLEDLAFLLRIEWDTLRPALEELIAAKRLEWDPTKWLLRDPDYEKHRRPTSTERVREWRKRNGETNETLPTLHHFSNDETASSLSVCLSVKEDLLEGEGVGEGDSQTRYREAYCRGVSEGKGGPYAWPESKQAQWDLNHCIKTFAIAKDKSPFRGEVLLRWIAHEAHRFADDVTRKDTAKFYSAYAPKGFKKWLNEDYRTEEAQHVR